MYHLTESSSSRGQSFIKFPYAPEPHTDSIHPDFKVWTIHLSEGAAISIRLKADSQPCDVALEKLKSMSNVPNQRVFRERAACVGRKGAPSCRRDTRMSATYVALAVIMCSLSCGQPASLGLNSDWKYWILFVSSNDSQASWRISISLTDKIWSSTPRQSHHDPCSHWFPRVPPCGLGFRVSS
jgi:hypothetical protein